MTVTTDDIWSDQSGFASPPRAITLRATGGKRMVVRGIQRFTGASLSTAALALWLLPVGTGSTAEILCKLMVTLVLGFAGAGFWQAGLPTPAPEIEIDLVRHEIRLVRWYGEQRSLVTRRRFRDLGRTDFDEKDVVLWDADGQMLAELSLPDMAAVDALRDALESDKRRPVMPFKLAA